MVASPMELRHLRYFVAVAEEENVTRAAARLHVSQPPLSRQIQELEQELGLPLFARTAKSIHLNEAGRKFLHEARAVLQRVDAAVAAVRGPEPGAGTNLDVAYAPTPTTGLLTPILRAFKKRAPGVRVTLHDTSTCEMAVGLRAGKFQVALTVQNSRTPSRGFAFEPLREDPVMLAVAPDHPLARRRSIHVKELPPLPFAVLSARQYPDYHDMLRLALGSVARRLRIGEECDGGASFITAIESGRTVAISSAALAYVAGRRVRLIPLLPAPSPLVVGVLHRPKALPPPGRILLEVARGFSQLK